MAVGIKEIARDLKLGISTVASALSGTGTIAPATRKRIVEHATKLGYTPNRNAQRIRSRKTGIIGLVVPDVVLSPYVETVQHLFRLVERQGQELQIALTEFYLELEDRALRNMLAARVDGIIAKVGFPRWEDVPGDHYLRRAKAEGVPVVLFSNPIEGSGMPYMKQSMTPSVKLVVRHFHDLGHKRIGAVLPAVRPFGATMQGWITAIREEVAVLGNTMEVEIIALTEGQASINGPRGIFRDYMNQNHPQHAVPAGRQLLGTALEMPNAPTALVAFTDPVAIGLVQEAQSLGLRVGRDIAIAGCGQMAGSFFSPVPLTTVDRRHLMYAEKLMGLLAAHMDESTRADAPAFDEIDPLLVVGESTIGA